VFSADDIFVVCDGPRLTSAAAASATSVLLSFDKPVDATSVSGNGSQFTVSNGLTVSAANVAGNTILLATSAQTPGTSYVVSVAESVTDIADRPVVATAQAGTFQGFAGLTKLIINELDYDQPSDDTLEFVEIYNPNAQPVDLSAYQLEMINGDDPADPKIYATHALSGTIPASGYAVVASDAVTVPNGPVVIRFSAAMNNIQNGARDGVRISTISGGIVLDAMLYEVPLDTEGPILTYAEGTAFVGGESNAEPNQSLARCSNGTDTDDNNVDFKLSDTPTPGASNICP
jgi:hypothetical protein